MSERGWPWGARFNDLRKLNKAETSLRFAGTLPCVTFAQAVPLGGGFQTD